MSRSSSFLILTSILVIFHTQGALSLEVYECNGTIANVKHAVRFLLFTNHNYRRPEEIYLYDPYTLEYSHFNPNLPTRIFAHGWKDSWESESSKSIVKAYLDNGKYNVIVVDWSELACDDYITARYHVEAVALVLAHFLEFLEYDGGLSLRNTYLIGFSLGAHVVGFAGKFVDSKVAVIIGLDPALPLFFLERRRCRLAYTDADYVLVIHSAVKVRGFASNIGHADFYINYGYALKNPTESHDVAYELFAKSLYPHHEYWGLKCSNFFDVTILRMCKGGNGHRAIMGEEAIKKRTKGIYNVHWSKTGRTTENSLTNSTLNEIEINSPAALNKTETIKSVTIKETESTSELIST